MKISLNQQIEELDRELKMRAEVYPRWIAAGKIRRSIAEYQVERMNAARTTLLWVQENEEKIKKALAP